VYVLLPSIALAVAPLAHRDPYDLPHHAVSAHFALRWGPDADPSADQQAAVLDVLEHAWSHGVDTLGMKAPTGSSTHYVNVYLGQTGGDAPPIGFVGGYVVPDLEGAEMMVLHPDLLLAVGGDEATLESIVTHEFFHVLQFASGALDGGAGPFAAEHQVWFWESTASWFAHDALPDNHVAPSLPAGYPLLPWLALDHYVLGADPLAFESGRIYHSSLFHRFLTEHVADPSLIVEAWQHPDDDADPLDVLDAGLAARGTSLDEVFLPFATHNVVLDYADGELYAAWAESHLYRGAPDERVAARYALDELPVTETLPAPQRYGYVVVTLDEVPEHGVLVLLDGDDVGSDGSPSALHAGWVARDAFGQSLHGVFGGPVVDDGWSLSAADLAGAVELHLVFTAQPPVATAAETFGLQITVDALPPPTMTLPGDSADSASVDTGAPIPPLRDPTADTSATADTGTDLVDEPAEEPACGCHSATVPTMAWWLPVLLPMISSRRRRARPSAR
jgi:hypothetical protein